MEMYNLQVPIPKELALQLKALAKMDERSLRFYCKKILQEHVNSNSINKNIIVCNEVKNDSNESEVNFEFESLD